MFNTYNMGVGMVRDRCARRTRTARSRFCANLGEAAFIARRSLAEGDDGVVALPMKARKWRSLVSGGGTNLTGSDGRTESSGILQSGEIVLVVSSRPDAYALTRARAAQGVEAKTITTGGRRAPRFLRR